MRVLLIRPGPAFSVQDVALGWRDGLTEIGCEVADFNLDDRLDFYATAHVPREGGEFRNAFAYKDAARMASRGIYEACYTFWPDIVLIVSGFFVDPEVIQTVRSHGHKVVQLFTESPYEDDNQTRQAERVDLALVNDPTNLDKFRVHNPETYYLPHAYDPKKHHPGPVDPDKACDFAFVGTGFPSRIQFLESIDWTGIAVKLGGNWKELDESSPLAPMVAHRRDWCISNEEAADLYRSCKSSLNLYRREANTDGLELGWSMGPREIELAACGAFFLRDPRPEGDDLFPMLPTFSSSEEVRPLLDWWLSHDKAREEAARRARAAIEQYTFRSRAEWLVNHLNR
jgi:spore maturation protein CgeB